MRASKRIDSRHIFFLGLLLAASGVVSPPFALAGGIVFGLTQQHPYQEESSSLSRLLLQFSVVALGFGINLHQVIAAGRSGFVYTAVSIVSALGLGLLLGQLLKVQATASFLISAGTAICGGSAIAALAPIANASEEEISVSMATVFVLNSVALLLFPALGAAMHFSQNQFGLWAALAIHDTSSVVGASAKYGAQALVIGTTVKLVRALWIVPLSLATAAFLRRRTRVAAATQAGLTAERQGVTIPWFILYFCLASVASTYLRGYSQAFATLNHLGRLGLTATLFLIGTSLSLQTLRKVGVRPMVQGVGLWIVVATLSAFAIHARWIAI